MKDMNRRIALSTVAVILCLTTFVSARDVGNESGQTFWDVITNFRFFSPWSITRFVLLVISLGFSWTVSEALFFTMALDSKKPGDKCPMPSMAFKKTFISAVALTFLAFVILFSIVPGQELRIKLGILPGSSSYTIMAFLDSAVFMFCLGAATIIALIWFVFPASTGNKSA